ncbi:VOC family protein [Streptomyces sp. AgN23]|uniref:VOC family protein n=1 Tax=Streptomyces sp. AgN23 TaxID=1188315 RepID=UPI001B3209C3|nr:VOC family protein [Streptomyces sp. AgN23]QTI87268.1 hypothetical protein AS97_39970 [Streptomyces sp. AgN23]
MINVLGVHHLGLTVADLDASRTFYEAGGYTVTDRLRADGPDAALGNGLPRAALDIVFADGPTAGGPGTGSPGLILELVRFDPPGERRVTAVDPAFGTVPLWSADSAGTDPDGRPVTAAGPGAVQVTLTTADPVGTARLLRLLGFEGAGRGGAADTTGLTGHGLDLALRRVPEPPVPPGPNDAGRTHLCCRVTDMTAAVAALDEAGFGTVSTPRVHGDLQWVFVRHPEGPGVELLCLT